MERKQIEISKKDLLALKAVCYGCNTNRKLAKGDGPTYCIFDDNMKVKEEITFFEALERVYDLIYNGDKIWQDTNLNQ